ncbi:MAG: ABC transporter ATP-binding protein [Clostridia bacterium]|jgi:NitT/TauT family transport system ATP-binding protein
MTRRKVVELQHVTMRYHSLDGETEAIRDVSLTVDEGEFIGIVGPSGCGKSTILSLIAGLIYPTSGKVYVNGNEVVGPSTKVGYMLQNDHLFEWRNIFQNVMLGLEIQKKVTVESIKKVEYLLDTYGLGDFKKHYPNQLSGGMRQRVALIRTLAIEPDILLLDEPFSALDYQTRLAVSDEVGTIIKKEKKTALLVTHDISEAISMSDKVVVLSQRPATIKNIYPIRLTCDEHTPINCRKAPEFREYFNAIWRELDVHVI